MLKKMDDFIYKNCFCILN